MAQKALFASPKIRISTYEIDILLIGKAKTLTMENADFRASWTRPLRCVFMPRFVSNETWPRSSHFPSHSQWKKTPYPQTQRERGFTIVYHHNVFSGNSGTREDDPNQSIWAAFICRGSFTPPRSFRSFSTIRSCCCIYRP